LFSGDGDRLDGLPQRLRARGATVIALDTKVGGAAHDLTRQSVRVRVEARVRAGEFAAVFMGTPCSSFSIAHKPQIRSRRHPLGLPRGPPEWAAYVAKHNDLAAWSAHVATIATGAGAVFMIENPADRGDELSPAFWRRMRDHAPLWLHPAVVAMAAATGARSQTFAQCNFEAAVQKYTTLMYSASMHEHMGAFRRAHRCSHTDHQSHAYGRDARGTWLAERAAAYPFGLSDAIAEAIMAATRAADRSSQTTGVAGGEDVWATALRSQAR
jgi:hypothetical protein